MRLVSECGVGWCVCIWHLGGHHSSVEGVRGVPRRLPSLALVAAAPWLLPRAGACSAVTVAVVRAVRFRNM